MRISDLKSKFKRSRARLNGYVDSFLLGTHDHYFCTVPERIVSLPSFFLNNLFGKISLNKAQTEKLSDLKHKGIVVYAGKYRSNLEFLFYHFRFRKEGLPAPVIGMDHRFIIWQPIVRLFRNLYSRYDHLLVHRRKANPFTGGYISRQLTEGKTGFITLVGEKSFYRRFIKSKTDPIQYLIEMQESCDRPIYIVPQLIFFNIDPGRNTPSLTDLIFGTNEHPGTVKKLFRLLKNPRKVFVEISDPLDLRAFLAQSHIREQSVAQQAVTLRRTLVHQINRHRQSITGPVLKTIEELKESILTNERLRQFMIEHAETSGSTIGQVHKKADGHLDEIAATYNPGVLPLYERILRWVFNSLFDGITLDQKGLEMVKRISQKGPLVLVPCHKSHLDYLLLSYLFYINNMPCPHIAAGKNLSFWPLGPLFRSAGAFFIRRTFKGTLLYPKVFGAYIEKLLSEGFNIEFFIEGGRSRTGKLLPPKFGILSFLIDAMRNHACEDLTFVPIYIGYDRIIEESSYIHEMEGGKKKPETFLQVLQARKFLKKRYGKVYVNFHEPFSLKNYLAEKRMSLSAMEKEETYALYRDLGYTFINAINKISVVTPHGLVASAILNSPKKRFSHSQLKYLVETYMNYLLTNDVELSDTLLMGTDRALDNVLDSYIQRKLIYSHSKFDKESSSNAVYMVNESKRPALDYYKNNCIVYFVPAAFTALAILENEAFQFSGEDLHITYKFLQDLFINEFSYDANTPPAYMVRKNIKAFIDDAIIVPHPTLPGTFNLTSAGLKKLHLFASFLKPFLESYWVVLSFLSNHPKESADSKECLKKIQTLGNRMYKNDEVDGYEALSRLTYKNGLKYFTENNAAGREDQEGIVLHKEALQKYLNLLQS